jgi:DNA-binding NarL/FixJ family response regulator
VEAGDTIALILQEPEDTAWPVLSLLKARDGEAFSNQDIGRFQALSYHLRFATRLRSRILAHGGIAPGVQAIFDFLPTPCALLNSGGTVLSINRAMDTLLRSEKTCGFVQKRFSAKDKATDDLLQRAIRQAAWGDIRGSRRGAAVTLADADGRKRVAVVTPIGDKAVLFDGISDACAAIYVVSEAHGSPRHDRLRTLLGLTAQEALTAADLIAGLAPEDIAAARQRSVATIRSHVNAIMRRNNFRRVGDLLAVSRLFQVEIEP